jgi:hypothetical protein
LQPRRRMTTRYRVLPAVRGYKVHDDETGRAVSVHLRRDDAVHRASLIARAEHVDVEVLDDDGVPCGDASSRDSYGPSSRRLRASQGVAAGLELADEPGMEVLDDDPVLEHLDEML